MPLAKSSLFASVRRTLLLIRQPHQALFPFSLFLYSLSLFQSFPETASSVSASGFGDGHGERGEVKRRAVAVTDVLMRMDSGGDGNEAEKNPTFIDLLTASTNCGEEPPPPALRSTAGDSGVAADPFSLGASYPGKRGLFPAACAMRADNKGVKSYEVFHFHGKKSSLSEPKVVNTLSGSKRSCSESIYSDLLHAELPVRSDSIESSSLIKMPPEEVVNENPRNHHIDDAMLPMPQQQIMTSLMMHPHKVLDSPISHPEQSLFKNPGKLLHPQSFSQDGTCSDTSHCTYKEASVVSPAISQLAIDEGSRASIKGSRVMSSNYPTRIACEGDSTGFLPRPKASQPVKSGPSNLVRNIDIKQATTSAVGRQMTIFYSGQAYVFDNVHPNKAHLIMALAGSTGGSWSTTISSKPVEHSMMDEAKVPTQAELRTGNPPSSEHGDTLHGLTQMIGIALQRDASGAHQSGMFVKDKKPDGSSS